LSISIIFIWIFFTACVSSALQPDPIVKITQQAVFDSGFVQ